MSPPVRLLLFLTLVGFGLAGFAGARLAGVGETRFHGTAYPDAPPAPGFTLTNHHGSTTSIEDLRGRAVLLFFGFTRCPDVCPLTLTRVARTLEAAGIGPEQVSVLLITVDPEHDTPARLAEYVDRFGPAITGLTGDPATLQTIFSRYGVYAERTAGHDGHPSIVHSTPVFGIDRGGRLRVIIRAGEPAEIVRADLRSLVRARG